MDSVLNSDTDTW